MPISAAVVMFGIVLVANAPRYGVPGVLAGCGLVATGLATAVRLFGAGRRTGAAPIERDEPDRA